jgi:hypothetical protein
MRRQSLMIFIICIIIALALALTTIWLNSFIFNPAACSYIGDMIPQSQSKIIETFAHSTSNFSIWPSNYDLRRGCSMRMSAGIKNNADDGADHVFSVSVIPTMASASVCAGGNVNSCNDLGVQMRSWVTFDKSSSVIQINKVGYKTITIKPSASAKLGSYIFTIVACKDIQSECTFQNSNWGIPQQLTITIS